MRFYEPKTNSHHVISGVEYCVRAVCYLAIYVNVVEGGFMKIIKLWIYITTHGNPMCSDYWSKVLRCRVQCIYFAFHFILFCRVSFTRNFDGNVTDIEVIMGLLQWPWSNTDHCRVHNQTPPLNLTQRKQRKSQPCQYSYISMSTLWVFQRCECRDIEHIGPFLATNTLHLPIAYPFPRGTISMKHWIPTLFNSIGCFTNIVHSLAQCHVVVPCIWGPSPNLHGHEIHIRNTFVMTISINQSKSIATCLLKHYHWLFSPHTWISHNSVTASVVVILWYA